MKKLLSIVLIVAMLFSLAACGSSEGGDAADDMPKIGILLLTEHPSLNTIKDSIIAGLTYNGYVDGQTCTIDVQNGQNDMSVMKSIAQKFVSNEYDIIIPIATPAAQAVLSETTTIPVIFAAISDPIGAGLLTDRDNPDGNITGTSDEVVAANMMKLADEMTPGYKTVGALFSAAEANSESVIAGLRTYCEENGLELIESKVTNTSEVQQAAQFLADKVDIVYSPIDNTVASAMAVATEIFNGAKIPFYVSADSMVADGGLAAYGIDYSVLGKETADMAADVLGGKSISELPVRIMSDLSLYVNAKTAKAIGLDTIPENAIDLSK